MHTEVTAQDMARAVDGLRGPPQLPQILRQLQRWVERAGTVSTDDMLRSVCDALVHGAGSACSDPCHAHLRNSLKLSLPVEGLLTSPAATGSGERNLLSRICADATLVRHLLLPLLARWRAGERARLVALAAQSGGVGRRPAFLKTDEDTRRRTNESMTNLLERVTNTLLQQSIETGGDSVGEGVDDPLLVTTTNAHLLGALAAAAGSFRTLSVGAALLLTGRLSLCASGAHGTPDAHADALVDEWVQYFAEHGGSALYEVESAANTPVTATGRWDGGESGWALGMCLLLSASDGLEQCGEAADGHGTHRDTVVRAFITRLRTLWERHALLQLSLTLGRRFSDLGTTLAARNYPVGRRLFWELSRSPSLGLRTDTAPPPARGDNTDGEEGVAWGGLVQLIATLTATQVPSEETAASTAVSLGERGDGLGTRSFYLGGGSGEGVLGAQLRFVASHEAELLDAAGGTRKRTREDAGEGSLHCSARPDVRAHRTAYLAFVFYAVYHPSCFTILRSGGELLLTSSLQRLHTLLNAGAEAAESGEVEDASTAEVEKADTHSAEGWTSSSDSDAEDEHHEGVGDEGHAAPTGEVEQETEEKMRPPSASRVAHHSSHGTAGWLRHQLRGDARLAMLLVHALLLQLERRGKVGARESAALTAWLIPSLIALGCATADRPRQPEGRPRADLWPEPQQSLFCLLTLIQAGVLLAMPWEQAGIYATLRRYVERSRWLRGVYTDTTAAAACLQLLRGWVESGDGPAGLPAGSLATGLDGVGPATAPLPLAGDQAWEERLREVAPLHLPTPCSLVVLVAMHRTLVRRLYLLRNAYEEQRALAEGDGGGVDYLTRVDTFCTTDDVHTFATLLHVTHRMVFAFQTQPPGLLRLWLGYLRHSVWTLVPPPASEDDVRLMPSSWQQETVVNCFGERVRRRGWRAAVKTPGMRYSPQTELRIALGHRLADLVMLPLADPSGATQCPPAFPVETASATYVELQARWAAEAAVVRQTLPEAVLEAICFYLAIRTDVVVPGSVGGAAGADSPTSPGPPPVRGEGEGEGEVHLVNVESLEEDHFLGLHGLVALCERLELGLVPGSVSSARVAHLIRCLWAAADATATGRAARL